MTTQPIECLDQPCTLSAGTWARPSMMMVSYFIRFLHALILYYFLQNLRPVICRTKIVGGKTSWAFFKVLELTIWSGFNSVRRRSFNGGMLPSTRDISNKIFAEVCAFCFFLLPSTPSQTSEKRFTFVQATIPSFDPKFNHFLMQFGQWIAHDIILTPLATGMPNNLSLSPSYERPHLRSNRWSSGLYPLRVRGSDD